jgi:hypothetical protein
MVLKKIVKRLKKKLKQVTETKSTLYFKQGQTLLTFDKII